jgi:LytR cell envelope-related transcriptional attenuator
MTKYARDEFDRVPETSSRQGVHRVASEAPRRRLGPILAVGIAALAIGVVAFLFLPKLGFSAAGNPLTMAPGSSVSSPAASPSTEASQDASPSSTATSSDAPSADSSASASPSAGSTSGTDAPGVDKTQPIAVYNGTATAGLASRVGGTVTAAGWTLGPVGNWGGMPQKTSVIYYSGEAQKGNAEALGSLLNITSLVDSAEFQMPVVVVLGPGFQ